MKKENKIEKKVIEMLDKIRPFLNSEGGDIEFVKMENGIVYVKMTGHCASCPMIDITLKDNIEMAITAEIPEVIEVRNINNE